MQRYKGLFSTENEVTEIRKQLTRRGARNLYLADKEEAIFFDVAAEKLEAVKGTPGLQRVVSAN